MKRPSDTFGLGSKKSKKDFRRISPQGGYATARNCRARSVRSWVFNHKMRWRTPSQYGIPVPATGFRHPQSPYSVISPPTASSSASAIQASLRARMAKGIHPSTSFRAHRHGGVPNREESYQDRDPSRSWYPRRRHWDIEDPGEPEIHCEIALRICVMSMSYTHESYVDERWR